jgi:hypothetical protein
MVEKTRRQIDAADAASIKKQNSCDAEKQRKSIVFLMGVLPILVYFG